MPRTNAPGELLKKTSLLRLYRIQAGTIGDTTTTAAVVGDGTETSVAVTAATNFTANDPALIIGDGGVELTKIGTPATTMPVSPPPKVPQATGARFVEAVAVDLGKIAKDTIQFTGTRGLQAIFEEIAETPVVYLPGDVEFGLDFALYGAEGLNLQTLLGYAEAETGTGAAEATAYQVIAGLSGQALQTEQVLRWQGLRHDAKKWQIDFLNAFFEGKISAAFGRSAPAQFQGGVKASAIIVRRFT